MPLNLPRLALRRGDWQKAGVNEEPPAKRRRIGNPWWWLIAVFAPLIGWQMLELHLYSAAVREAKEAGMEWTCKDTISLIRQDWHNALKKETWGEHDRVLMMGEVRDLGRYCEMLRCLRPTILRVDGCEDENVDGLKNLTGLKEFALVGCSKLQNVDGLKGHTGLQRLWLDSCLALKNVDGVKGLSALQSLQLNGCAALQNTDGLKGLTGMRVLYLDGCDKIPAAALRELRAALPKTDITFPDGTKNPPQ